MVRISEWTPAAATELRRVSEDNFRPLIYAPRLTWLAGRHEQSFRDWVRSRGFEGLERAINNDQETHGASLLRRWKNGYVELPSGQYKITAENLREALGLPFGDSMIGSAQGRDINPRFIQNLGKYNRKDGLQISNVPDHLKPVFKFMVAALDVRKSNSSVSKTITFMYEALQFGDPIDVAAYIFQRLKKETETTVEAIAGGADQVQTCVVPFYEALAWMGAETSRRPQLDRVIRMDCPAEEETEETEEGAEDEPEESVDETPKLKGQKRAVTAAAAHTPVPKKKLKLTGRAKGKKPETPKTRRKQARAGTPGVRTRSWKPDKEAEPAEPIQLSDSREELGKKSQEERGDPNAEEVQKKPLEKESEKPQEHRAETRVDPETVEEYSDRLRDISAKNGQEAEARTECKGVTTSLMRRYEQGQKRPCPERREFDKDKPKQHRNEEPRPSSPATMFMNAIRGMEQQQGGKAVQFSPEEVAKALQADQVLLVNQEVFDRRFFGPLNAAVAEMKSEVNSAIAEMKEEEFFHSVVEGSPGVSRNSSTGWWIEFPEFLGILPLDGGGNSFHWMVEGIPEFLGILPMRGGGNSRSFWEFFHSVVEGSPGVSRNSSIGWWIEFPEFLGILPLDGGGNSWNSGIPSTAWWREVLEFPGNPSTGWWREFLSFWEFFHSVVEGSPGVSRKSVHWMVEGIPEFLGILPMCGGGNSRSFWEFFHSVVEGNPGDQEFPSTGWWMEILQFPENPSTGWWREILELRNSFHCMVEGIPGVSGNSSTGLWREFPEFLGILPLDGGGNSRSFWEFFHWMRGGGKSWRSGISFHWMVDGNPAVSRKSFHWMVEGNPGAEEFLPLHGGGNSRSFWEFFHWIVEGIPGVSGNSSTGWWREFPEFLGILALDGGGNSWRSGISFHCMVEGSPGAQEILPLNGGWKSWSSGNPSTEWWTESRSSGNPSTAWWTESRSFREFFHSGVEGSPGASGNSSIEWWREVLELPGILP
ncbi:hypothetical protein SELMODRAFT_430139 [Selaginella moellendorffii]|uniref:Uncharacterized protein n=1 Tax=Selaginella moellendorffii TaxID=88036 RepID=D8T8G6_SELML|nr:hypothetical protein SELMODRAFT_430139 [Selaginella moellendorffii]